MDGLAVVWVDFREVPSTASPVVTAATGRRVLRVTCVDRLLDVLPRGDRSILCFEFDTPDRAGLLALVGTKARHPSRPILMLTQAHSESLAVWALRARVWDYLVMPFSAEHLSERFRAIEQIQWSAETRRNGYPAQPLPIEASVRRRPRDALTQPAFDYLHSHFEEPLCLRAMAALCHLSPTQFCRVFKREHGASFGELLLRQRILTAQSLLRTPRTAISDVAYAVGFNDLSYFSRVFRRHTGMSASSFRLQALDAASDLTRGRAEHSGTAGANGMVPSHA